MQIARLVEIDFDARADHLQHVGCLLYTSDAADERSSVDLGGRRIIKKQNNSTPTRLRGIKRQQSRTHTIKTHTK